jgi:SAM-dependent methyltransferase
MQQRAFEEIHLAEGTWWYDGRAFLVQRLLRSFGAKTEKICDIGAGYGAMCPALKPFGHTTAFEPDVDARAHCVENFDTAFGSGDLSELVRSEAGEFSLVTLLDVVEHVEDDLGFLEQVNKVIRPGGHILVTVPAFMSLWSELDVLAMHYYRYNRKGIIRSLEQTGFEIRYASYWNMMLTVPAFIVRRGTGKGGYAAFAMPRWIDRLFFAWVWFETLLIPLTKLPFGTTVVVYAQKKAGPRV